MVRGCAKTPLALSIELAELSKAPLQPLTYPTGQDCDRCEELKTEHYQPFEHLHRQVNMSMFGLWMFYNQVNTIKRRQDLAGRSDMINYIRNHCDTPAWLCEA